jgi:hypothetical protein
MFSSSIDSVSICAFVMYYFVEPGFVDQDDILIRDPDCQPY